MLHHGGGLNSVAKQYNIAVEKWLDLSTGINPYSWPVPQIPAVVYNRLPQNDDELLAVAKKYYGARFLLAIAGSQAAIQLLPKLRGKCRVAVPIIGYAEHAHAWREAGHQVDALTTQQIEENIHLYDVLVVINPNNPTGEYLSREKLLQWHKVLQKKSGWLIVDEAFIDSCAENSLAGSSHLTGMIVLRSVGKFFGLAGIRSGFVLAEKTLLKRVENALGPWQVSGPSRFICCLALQDKSWQKNNSKKLQQESAELKKLIEKVFLNNASNASVRGTDLFQTLFCDNAVAIHNKLMEYQVYTRLLDNRQGVRFGLPGEKNMSRLESVLGNIKLK